MLIALPIAAVGILSQASPALAATPGCGQEILPGSSWLGGAGASVRSNGSNQGSGISCGGVSTSSPSVQDGYGWQCVELAARLYATKGWGTVHAGGNNGAAYIPEGTAGMVFHANGDGYAPVPGDMIIFNPTSSNPYGHVAIVDSVAGATINDVEQNASWSGRGTVTVSGATLQGGVKGVEHSPKNTNSSGGSLGSKVAAIATSDGHIQIFATGSGVIRQSWYSPSDGTHGGWTTSLALGGQAVGTPAVVARAGQQVEDLFVRGGDGQLYETWYNWGSGAWGGWIGLGGTISSDPSALATSDGHEQIFATNGGLVRQTWFGPGNGAVGGWFSF
jgi:hypothetical protein